MAGISDADQSGFPLQGFNSGGSTGAGLSIIFGFGEARGTAWNSGMAEFLFQVTDVRAGTLSGARFIYSADEVEKYFALDEGRRVDHAFGLGILRLRRRARHDMRRSQTFRGELLPRRKSRSAKLPLLRIENK